MPKIIKSYTEIRAHRPDPAMIAPLREKDNQDILADPDETTSEPMFRIREAVRRRIVKGDYRVGDLAAFRAAFRSVSQTNFASALGISVDTLQNWEQGRRQPVGPARALLRLLARHPGLLVHDLIPGRRRTG